MQCPKCKYVMTDFETECPRCAINKPPESANLEREDVVRNSTFKPSQAVLVHPFPTEGEASVARNGMRYGPYSLEQINGYLKSGHLLQSDQLLTDSNEWIVLRKIEGVIVPPPAPPAPPPIHNDLYSPASNQVTTFYEDAPLSEEDRRNANALAAFGFLFPYFGLIIWIIALNIKPKMASIIGRWSLIGFVVGVVIFAFIGLS